MNKIAIITIYHKNYNYDGQLQAYALTNFLNNKGFISEQIDFDRVSGGGFLRNKGIVFIKWPYSKKKEFILNHFQRWKSSKNNGTYSMQYENTIKKFNEFISDIPHTSTYNKSNIHQIGDVYDFYITGSDQVWNMDYCTDEYFLDFVKNKNKCISYAASMQVLNLLETSKQKLYNQIKDYKAISVREVGAKNLIESVGIENVNIVCDPVMLLNRTQWDTVVQEPETKKKYIFAYLIQREKKERSIECEELANKLGLELICITSPGWENDLSSSIKQIPNGIGPREFLGLIKNAEYVITDSFHAIAFSIIFNKVFFSYGEDDRKTTLLNFFGLSNQIVKKSGLQNAFHYKYIDYFEINKKLSSYNKSSINYLEGALHNGEEDD